MSRATAPQFHAGIMIIPELSEIDENLPDLVGARWLPHDERVVGCASRVLSGPHDQRLKWASDFLALLLNMKDKVDTAKSQGQESLCALQLAAIKTVYNQIVARGEQANPPPVGLRGRLKQSSVRNLLDRLINHKDKIMAFGDGFEAPCDNNLAERAIRMVKVQQKVSGGFRSGAGADVFCQVRSYISTARKNGQRVLDVLFQALSGTPYSPLFIQTQPLSNYLFSLESP